MSLPSSPLLMGEPEPAGSCQLELQPRGWGEARAGLGVSQASVTVRQARAR